MSSCTTCGSPNLPSATACAFCANLLAPPQPVAVAAAPHPMPHWQPPPPPAPPPPPRLVFFHQPRPVSTWPLPAQPLRRPPSRQGLPMWSWLVMAALVVGLGVFATVLIMGHTVKKSVETATSGRSYAQERAAQSNARNALTASLVQYVDTSKFTNDLKVLAEIESRLEWVNGVATLQGQVSVSADDQRVVVSAVASDGQCFSLSNVGDLGTSTYAVGTGPCDATRPPGEFSASGWPPFPTAATAH